jgi:glucosylceramidase
LPVAISECTGGDWEKNFGQAAMGRAQPAIDRHPRRRSWVTKWNVALDPSGGPKNGGCGRCRGLVTIDPETGTATRNADYWALAHLGRFVTPGADVIASTSQSWEDRDRRVLQPRRLPCAAGDERGRREATFRVRADERSFIYTLPAGAVATFTW